MKCTKCELELSIDNFHKDKQKSLGYRSTCKGCRKKEASVYFKKNRNMILDKNNIWMSANKDKYKLWQAKYYRSSNYKCCNAARSALTRGAKGDGTVTMKSLLDLRNKTKKCCVCKSKLQWNIRGKVHLDHKIPICKGGLHIISNVRYICSICNRRKAKSSSDNY